MLMKQIIEAYEVLDDTYVTGEKVKEYLLGIKPDANIEVYELVGPKGSTDMLKVRIPGKNGKLNGGITVSGGEPLLQTEFVTEFFGYAKEKGIHTTLDTAGNPFTMEEPYLSKFNKLMEVTDLIMLDFKEIVNDKHKQLTGWENENIIQMARYMSDMGKDMWIRHVLVPGLTDDEEGLYMLRDLIRELKTVRKVEILPYHTLGLAKWDKLNIKYPLEGIDPPTPEQVARAEEILEVDKYN